MVMTSGFTVFFLFQFQNLCTLIFFLFLNGLEITIIYYHISNIFFVLVSLHSIMLLITGWKRVT